MRSGLLACAAISIAFDSANKTTTSSVWTQFMDLISQVKGRTLALKLFILLQTYFSLKLEVMERICINNNQSSFRLSVQVANIMLDKQGTHFIKSAKYSEQNITHGSQLFT